MTLREQQSRFVVLVARLIEWCGANGYELTFSEAWRSPTEAQINASSHTGIVHSLHTLRLAIDLNLFKDGTNLTSKEDYAPLGVYWKTLDPLCCWGGEFQSPDSDHFSMTYNGVK